MDVEERVKVRLRADFVPPTCDFVTANILVKPLVTRPPLLASSVRTDGKTRLAGLLESHQEEVRQAYTPWLERRVARRLKEQDRVRLGLGSRHSGHRRAQTGRKESNLRGL